MKTILSLAFVVVASIASIPANNKIEIVREELPLYLTDEGLSPKQEIQCLALTVYGEAANQGRLGQIAVAYTVMNRMKNKAETTCDIVSKKFQYTIYLMPKYKKALDSIVNNKFEKPADVVPKYWDEAVKTASDVYNFRVKDPTHGATHYVSYTLLEQQGLPIPDWTADERAVVKAEILDHTFFAGI